MKPLDPPRLVQRVAEACRAAGGRAVLVGGSVRDHLLGSPVKDWDLEVYGLPTDDLETALRTVGRVDTVGKAFSVFKIHRGNLELDVSLPRRDSKQGAGHRGILAEGDPTMTPDEAARRRDLTINALMLDLHDGTILDPAGGQADLAAGLLRPVDADTFLEDPLRALRAVQFAARLDFQPTPDLLELCREAALDELPEERVLMEWAKLMLKGVRPSTGLALARDARLLPRVFPEHPHPDSLDAQLDAAAAQRDRRTDAGPWFDPEGARFALMLAVWLTAAPPHTHEALLDRLKLHRWHGHPTRDVTLAVAAHAHDPVATDADLRWLSTRAPVRLVLAVRAVHTGEDPAEREARAALLGVLDEAPPPFVQGRDLMKLGVRPGPHMGDLLKHTYGRQLDGDLCTPTEALTAVEALAKSRGHLV